MALSDKKQRIGITEAGEIAFNLSAFDNLYDGNIIITKRLTDKLIEKLIEYKDKIILHLTCTGYGSSVLEPFVPTVKQTYDKFIELLDKGFPIEHVVLRIDPCIPTEKGMQTMINVVEMFKNCGIKRVRFSVLDMYKHVKDRFHKNGLKLPYETFHASLVDRMMLYNVLNEYGEKYHFDVEACGEPDIKSIPCLSQKDIDILGLTDKINLVGNKEQRKSCHCPSNKTELLRNKPHQCENACLYCFWKK
jgi:DNA repair photolyase